MAYNLGERKVLKEFKIEINEKGKVKGFMDLVSKRRIRLKGTLKYFSDFTIPELNEHLRRKGKKFQGMILHFRCKDFIGENDLVFPHVSSRFGRTEKPKEYLRYFTNEIILFGFSAGQNNNWLSVECHTREDIGDFRVSKDVRGIEILENKRYFSKINAGEKPK